MPFVSVILLTNYRAMTSIRWPTQVALQCNIISVSAYNYFWKGSPCDQKSNSVRLKPHGRGKLLPQCLGVDTRAKEQNRRPTCFHWRSRTPSSGSWIRNFKLTSEQITQFLASQYPKLLADCEAWTILGPIDCYSCFDNSYRQLAFVRSHDLVLDTCHPTLKLSPLYLNFIFVTSVCLNLKILANIFLGFF